MLLFDGRGVAYSYESTVPAPLLPSSDQSNNLPQSNKAPPMVDARSGECPRTESEAATAAEAATTASHQRHSKQSYSGKDTEAVKAAYTVTATASQQQ